MASAVDFRLAAQYGGIKTVQAYIDAGKDVNAASEPPVVEGEDEGDHTS